MESKKISFGFLKTKKQAKPAVSETKEYIDCLEGKSIKVVGGDGVEEIIPLVIPMKANTLITAERLKAIAEKVENFDEPIVVKQEKEVDPPCNESLDQMAVRELMEGAKTVKVEVKEELVVPINVKPVMDGQAEATLDDYESVPIQDFGLAMLRGMGWTESTEQSKYKQPSLRPKGLGLGADKIAKDNQKNKTGNEEELPIVKNSFVKITHGKYSGHYGKVISLDDHNGRVLVNINMKKETVSLSEFMMEAVNRTDFDKVSRVINSESYESYKKNEKIDHIKHNSREINESSTSKMPSDKERHNPRRNNRTEQRKEENRSNEQYSNGRRSRSRETLDKSKDRYTRESSSSEEDRSRHRKKNNKKYSSNETLSSDADKRNDSVDRRRGSSSSSEANYRKKNKSKNKVKKDIDKKRKGKKKKRDRDRSPNYKKHRK